MVRVTLTIERGEVDGVTETHAAEGPGTYVLPLVFRVTNAAIRANPDEIRMLTAAMRVIEDALAAASVPASNGSGVRS